MGKLLLIVGLVISGIGVLIMLGVPFGRLPGDITIRRGNSVIYLPIVTCLVISLVLSVILSFFRR